ncbi:hypothetical protein ACQYJI_005486, partial [Pseudomonas aeruginosa]
IPVAAGLGTHQPDRRLRLAAEPQAGGREVQAATVARKTLAYDFFRILRAPPIEECTVTGMVPWPDELLEEAREKARRKGERGEMLF